MPIDIQRLESDVTVLEGELPLSDQQFEQLVQRVFECVQSKLRQERQFQESTSVRRGVSPPLQVGE